MKEGVTMPDTSHCERRIRASDMDRERTAAALGSHYAAGRLTLGEFQERLDLAYAAKTLGELEDLMTDLPETGSGQLQAQPGTNPPPPEWLAPGQVHAPVARRPAVWQFWAGITIGIFVIWLMSGATGGPWFLWLAVPLALVLLRRWLLAQERRIRNHQQNKR